MMRPGYCIKRALWSAGLAVGAFAMTLGATARTPASSHDLAHGGDRASSDWSFATSDLPPDPKYGFGRLANGMGYVIRRNATPKGRVEVRMDVAVGSLDERDSERGYAHFVEHMAFNGSRALPEGEMLRILERQGLSNGPDANASTDFEATTYRFDLPHNNGKLLALSLSLMRQIASELTFDPQAVERAKGVVLAEMRDSNTWKRRNSMDRARFLHPGALFPRRFSIGVPETLQAASADALKAFWQRTYDPARTTIIVVGDVDPAFVRRQIMAQFSGWQTHHLALQPDPGPVAAADAGRSESYLEPPISEQMTVARHGPWIDGPDTLARRHERWLRRIGYAIINRRLQHVARQPDPPFRAAQLGTSGVFLSGRSTSLTVDTVDGSWRTGLIAAATEYRRAMLLDFSPAELAEQVAVLRNELELAANSQETRTNTTLANRIMDLLRYRRVPTSPQAEWHWFRAFASQITPETVAAALARDAVPLDNPLLRLEGSRVPEGGEAALRDAWNSAMNAPLLAKPSATAPEFAYARPGPPGRVIHDRREPRLGIRTIRFANGVMLNLKRTRLEKGRVRVEVNLDGGEMLNTRANPTVTQLVRVLPVGGLGRHTFDELQSLRAGHTTEFNFAARPRSFASTALTTPADLEFQLELCTALITDPAYRTEGEVEYRLNTNNFFNGLRSTPTSVLNAAIGGILSDNDPRFTLQPVEAYRALTFARLKQDIADRLQHGAIEIGIVGDVDERSAIAAVARTFGALPARETQFQAYAHERMRSFTAERSPRTLLHSGPSDQALLRLTWPTRDDSDAEESLKLELLERVIHIALTEELRQRFGKAYSPEASSDPSRDYRFGAFSVAVTTDVKDVARVRALIADVIASTRDRPVSADVFSRARQPLLEDVTSALKSNWGWMTLVSHAQSESDRIDRHIRAKARLLTLTPSDVQAVAQRYLLPEMAVEVAVLPETARAP